MGLKDYAKKAAGGFLGAQAKSAKKSLLGGTDVPPPPGMTAEELEIQKIILGQLRSGSQMQEMLMPYMMEEMGYRVIDTPPSGDDPGGRTLERISPEERFAGMDPQERKTYELHDAYLDRQLSAVRGELPVSPALERDISERRGLVQEDLSRRLGPQYKQSTAGLQTEAKFEESADIAKESARQGIISQGPGLIGSSQAGMEGRTQADIAGLYNVPQSYYTGIGAAGSALQPYQQQRGLQYQSQMQSGANKAAQKAGLMQLAGMGAMAMSSKDYKEDIKRVGNDEADEALDLVKNGNTYTYKYKKGLGQPKGKRIGLVTEDAPRKVVSPDGKMLDIPQEIGLLRTAVKALAKKEEKRKKRRA
jgi:hypothetical protein